MRKIDLKSHYDLVIVGAGIQGCAMLWEAQSRGLDALLVDTEDYCSQTSANSLKTIHGGIRYLQTLNFPRTIRSAKEQETLLKIAPHLIKPLPCLLPTEKKIKRSRLAVSTGFNLYNLIKSIFCPDHKLPKAGCISKNELSKYEKRINNNNVTGAGLWHDAQVQHAERLGLAFVKTAHNSGADAFNYLKAENLSISDNNQLKLNLQCQLSDNKYQVLTDSTIFCTAVDTAKNVSSQNFNNTNFPDFCLALNIVTNDRYSDLAIGLQSGFAQNINGSGRLLFAAPWRDKTLFGTWYFKINIQTESTLKPTEQQIESCINEINITYPDLNLGPNDINEVHHGLLPLKRGQSEPGNNLLEKDLILKPNPALDVFAVIPTKYTTCRATAEQTIDKLAQSLNKKIGPSISAKSVLIGGSKVNVEKMLTTQKQNPRFTPQVIEQLLSNYGSEVMALIEFTGNHDGFNDLIPGSDSYLKLQLDYELENGQVEKLSDFVLRRSFLAYDSQINAETLRYCAHRINKFHQSDRITDTEITDFLNLNTM